MRGDSCLFGLPGDAPTDFQGEIAAKIKPVVRPRNEPWVFSIWGSTSPLQIMMMLNRIAQHGLSFFVPLPHRTELHFPAAISAGLNSSKLVHTLVRPTTLQDVANLPLIERIAESSALVPKVSQEGDPGRDEPDRYEEERHQNR